MRRCAGRYTTADCWEVKIKCAFEDLVEHLGPKQQEALREQDRQHEYTRKKLEEGSNVQVHGSTNWKSWCGITCCRRHLQCPRAPEELHRISSNVEEKEEETQLGSEKEQDADARHAMSKWW